jgi:excisionase family DNA binding protein
MMDKILTPAEICCYLQISQRTLYRLLSRGSLPFAMKIDGSWRFFEKDVLEYLENSKIHSKVLKVISDCIQDIENKQTIESDFMIEELLPKPPENNG